MGYQGRFPACALALCISLVVAKGADLGVKSKAEYSQHRELCWACESKLGIPNGTWIPLQLIRESGDRVLSHLQPIFTGQAVSPDGWFWYKTCFPYFCLSFPATCMFASPDYDSLLIAVM